MLSAIQTANLWSQHLTSSPYSMYGLGQKEVIGNATNRGLGGISTALSSSNQVNLSNPASLSTMDSLSFYFDAGLSLRKLNYELGGNSEKRAEGNINHFSMGMKPLRWWGVAFGMTPYTTVGYSIKDFQYIEGSSSLQEVLFEGDGGLSKVFLSNSVAISDKLSMGLTASYIFGSIYHNELQTNMTIEQKSYTKTFHTEYAFLYQSSWIKSFPLNIGLTYSPSKEVRMKNEQNVKDKSDNILTTEKLATSIHYLPEQFSLGFSTQPGEKWLIGMEYERQNWNSNSTGASTIKFSDTNRISLGTGWTPYPRNARNLVQATTYRLGLGIENSPYTTRGTNPLNYKISVGLGIPLKRTSAINIALSYENDNVSSPGVLSSEIWQLNASFSFVERWFEKQKFR